MDRRFDLLAFAVVLVAGCSSRQATQVKTATRKVATEAGKAATLLEAAAQEKLLETKVQAALVKAEHLDAALVKVHADGSKVRLTGEVRTEEQKKRAETLARQVEGVTDVQNDLVVNPKLKTSEQAVRDLQLLTAVRLQLLTELGTSAAHIDVRVTGSSVELLGTVTDKEQKSLAEKVTGRVEGVTKVINHIGVKGP